MQTYNGIGLRGALEQMETSGLDELLQAELGKEKPDADAVRLIVSVLEERESELPLELTPKDEEAWKQYQKRMAGLQEKPLPLRQWLTVAASMAIIVGLMFAVVPQQAEAESFWEMLQRWSDNILEIFNPREHVSSLEYHFESDNPGLQQVYDAVVELGVTEPVVPMWLPEGCELTMFSLKDTPMLKGVWARFSHGESGILYKVDIYEGEPARQFYRDDSYYEEYEKNGLIFYITQNNGSWGAVWTKDNIECSIILDCQEDTLRRILRSIYVIEGQ